ncbi:MAG: hypothetical protein U0872_15355 [Planctomycetaceae bacterium]
MKTELLEAAEKVNALICAFEITREADAITGDRRAEERWNVYMKLAMEFPKLSEILDCFIESQNEIASVLMLMDGLAEQWGDEGVFRRCRDRLRNLVTT